MLGLKLILASPPYETTPSDDTGFASVIKTEEIETSTGNLVSSKSSEDLKTDEAAVGFLDAPIDEIYISSSYWGGYDEWGGARRYRSSGHFRYPGGRRGYRSGRGGRTGGGRRRG